MIPEIKDKIRIKVQVWRDGGRGDDYESYLQEAGQRPSALAAAPHPPPGPQHPQAGLLDDGEHHSLHLCDGLPPASSSSISSLDFFFLQIDRVKTSSQSW